MIAEFIFDLDVGFHATDEPRDRATNEPADHKDRNAGHVTHHSPHRHPHRLHVLQTRSNHRRFRVADRRFRRPLGYLPTSLPLESHPRPPLGLWRLACSRSVPSEPCKTAYEGIPTRNAGISNRLQPFMVFASFPGRPLRAMREGITKWQTVLLIVGSITAKRN
jgi:hypothetical protein